MTLPVSNKTEIKELIDWLRKRAMPDSGIHYKSDHFDTGAYVELHGQDAKFVASHFHGAGATQLADALEKIVALASPQPVQDMHELPEVVAWLFECTKGPYAGEIDVHSKDGNGGSEEMRVKSFYSKPYPVIRLSDHSAVVKKLEGEIAAQIAGHRETSRQSTANLIRANAAEKEIAAAKNDLRSFMTSFVREHFPDNKGWQPLPDLLGMLSQMDNASTVARDYVDTISSLTQKLDRAREALKPFALEGQTFLYGSSVRANIKMKDIYAARSFLAALSEPGESR